MPANREFSVHVHKLMGNAQRPALFTIGLWEGNVLRAICYTQPLDAALLAVRKVLEESGTNTETKESCRSAEWRNNHLVN